MHAIRRILPICRLYRSLFKAEDEANRIVAAKKQVGPASLTNNRRRQKAANAQENGRLMP
jgi:hypothetical protein